MSQKHRLDQLLVERGLAKSRSAAQRFILAGEVLVNGQVRDKPASQVASDSDLSLKAGPKYVSQGGLKLEKALDQFKIDVDGKNCLDLGASTGGFTDCLLQHGADKVYAVDVGKGQLDWKLRNDERVVVLESLNARYLSFEEISEPIEFLCADVSFISLKLVIAPAMKLLSEAAELVLLVKPQFEAGPENVERGGVVKSLEVHAQVLEDIAHFMEDDMKLSIQGATFSPFKGPAGNVEFLLYLRNNAPSSTGVVWAELVDEAHRALTTSK